MRSVICDRIQDLSRIGTRNDRQQSWVEGVQMQSQREHIADGMYLDSHA